MKLPDCEKRDQTQKPVRESMPMEAHRNLGGRPCLLDDEKTRALILEGIAAGLTYELACNIAGVTYRTFRNWVSRGLKSESTDDLSAKPEEARFIQFFQAVKKAEAQAEVTLLTRIRNASKDSNKWQAAAWILERRWPKRWGRRDRVGLEHSSPGSKSIEVAVSVSPAEELIELIYGPVAATRSGEKPPEIENRKPKPGKRQKC